MKKVYGVFGRYYVEKGDWYIAPLAFFDTEDEAEKLKCIKDNYDRFQVLTEYFIKTQDVFQSLEEMIEFEKKELYRKILESEKSAKKGLCRPAEEFLKELKDEIKKDDKN